jgi:hypothetical protein
MLPLKLTAVALSGFFLLLASDLAAAPRKLSAACGPSTKTVQYCDCASDNCVDWCRYNHAAGTDARGQCLNSCYYHHVACKANAAGRKPGAAAPDRPPDIKPDGGSGPKPKPKVTAPEAPNVRQ